MNEYQEAKIGTLAVQNPCLGRFKATRWIGRPEAQRNEVCVGLSPYGFISLEGMLQLYVSHWYELGELLSHLERMLWAIRETESVKSLSKEEQVKRSAQWLKDNCTEILRVCEELTIPVSVEACREMQALEDPTEHEVSVAVEHFQKTLKSELRSRMFLYVRPADALLYLEGVDGWAKSTARFNGTGSAKSIITDVEEANKCFALQRYTACVFHLMRVIEMGVQEFGLALGYTVATERVWGTITNAIKEKVAALPAGPEKTNYEGLIPYLDTVRRVWRNNVMHPKDEYTEEQAREILLASRIFMEHLAQVI